jgi:hypothetical protein
MKKYVLLFAIILIEFSAQALGNQIEQLMFKSNGSLDRKWVYLYDKKKYLIEESVYSAAGVLGFKRIYKNDGLGNRIEANGYKPDGSPQPGMKYTNQFDDKNNIREEKIYKANEALELTFKFKYDDKGNIIEENQLQPNGDVGCKTYKYEFDIEGNWIKKIEFRDDKPISVTERKIEYF